MANLFDEKALNTVEDFARQINEAKALQEETMPDNVECMIHIDVDEEDGVTPECYYYLVHPQKRILFWMNEFNAGDYLVEIEGVTEPTHISKGCTKRHVCSN